MPTTKTHISKSFAASNPEKNKKREFVHNKVFNANPGPGEYKVDQTTSTKSALVKKSFNKVTGSLGPKPKKFYLGRPDRGSIYEDPTASFPGPTSYQQKGKAMMNITGMSSDRLLM